MRITVIHPSRSRPQLAEKALINWKSKSSGKHEIEHILSVDTDDPYLQSYDALRFLGYNTENYNFVMYQSANRSAIDAINKAARISKGDILIVCSDDFDCPQNWDEQIVNFPKHREDWIMHVHDGFYGQLITIPIMSREYYKKFGYIYFPEYLHMFCDTELTDVSMLTGCYVNALQIVFKHNHYSSKTGIKKDAVSEKADKTWSQGELLYNSRKSINFGINA